MSDFQSINELMKKGGTKKKSDDVQEQLSQKIKTIRQKGREEDTEKKAKELGLPYINLYGFPVSAESLRLIPESVAREKNLICFYSLPDKIKLAVTDLDDSLKEYAYQLGEKGHAETEIYLISQNSLDYVLKLYANLPVIKPVSKEINITEEELNKYQVEMNNIQSLEEKFKNINITDILTLIIASALKLNSSDIHVEAEEKGIAVRYRIDGVLHDVANLPIEQWKRFVSRIKLLAALKINITDKPQDGRVTLKLPSGNIDVRVSTMPTTYGESVVMRILFSGSKGVTFDDLGFYGDSYERLKREVERPNGMIITTGPTGSGKTTTLYAILRTLNKPGVKIITLEDPVEIKMEGVNQSQVDPSRDYTFAKGLRSILRQDPDICMVGEIRDLETAEIAIQAALTGHLMLSTIHTNSASGALPRFLSMGVKPFLLAPSLNAIIGQRLVRRTCPKCIEEIKIDDEKMARVKEQLEKLPENEKNKIDFDNLKFYHGKGCEACSGLGYKGRIGIYEIFTMNKEIEEIILTGQTSEYAIQEIAVKNGMVTMVQDGILKALNKVTTVEEVFRVTE
ncbi:MAG TPA: GspE/PulE family protein [Candidatus Magasanikbacteria bacterium]|nr:GspE/PulE family protein [Candidatus Magasanikbacteria bacterium]